MEPDLMILPNKELKAMAFGASTNCLSALESSLVTLVPWGGTQHWFR